MNFNLNSKILTKIIKMREKKYFYFCPRGLSKHLHIYTGWVIEARRNNLPIYLFTTLSFKEFLKLPSSFKKREFIFIPCFKVLDKLITTVYFIFQILTNKITIIHTRKRGTYILEKLKLFFSKKFKFIIESEGDIIYEFDYLKKHPYKKNFYSSNIKNTTYTLKRYEASLQKADHILCVSENLKNLYISRYSIDKHKLTSITTGCDSNKFKYDRDIRSKYRKILDLESYFVMIYVGSVYFSWQRISRTLEIYKLIKRNIKTKTKMIIITRKEDKSILFDFLKRKDIKPDELILKFSVPNEEIPNYLNASDLGIILRDNHPLNNVAAPGKFGEYLCCGLPILTGVGISDFSERVSETSYGMVLEDIYDDNEVILKFTTYFTENSNINRQEISKWASDIFSFQKHIKKYVNTMQNL